MNLRNMVVAALSLAALPALAAACGSVAEATPSGDCQSSADCSGNPCVEATPGGYKICQTAPPEATGCTNDAGPITDGCCTSADCQGGGLCFDQSKLPACGGPFPASYNACIGDACQGDADCADSEGIPRVCAPRGAWGNPVRACVNAYCKTDADCAAAEGGRCAPVLWACCATPLGLACVYPGGCTRDSDCGTDGTHACQVKDGKGQCVAGPTGCPA